MQGTNFIPHMTLAMMPKAVLTWALEVPGEVCEDAIAADFDEMRKKIKNQLVVIGRYHTKQVFNSRGLFQRMRQVWQLRAGMEEKSFGDNHLMIEFKHEGDYWHVLWSAPWLYKGSPQMCVPPIEDCLLSEIRLLEEIRDGAARIAAAFIKKTELALGKRVGLTDGKMQNDKQSVVAGEGSGNKSRLMVDDDNAIIERLEVEKQDEEAAGLGAAGTLTGAEGRACQQP
jgi:hypothetical protein